MAVTRLGRRVVVGVDASQHALRAADWAAAEAELRGVPLQVVHANDFDPGSALPESAHGAVPAPASRGRAHLLDQIEHRVHVAHPELSVITEAVAESAPGALVAASRNAGLLVVGTRGRGGFAGLALGSVSMRVAAHAHCPVVVIRARGNEVVPEGEVVLGMEHGESLDAVQFAFDAAARAATGLHAIHAWVPYPAHAQDYVSDTDIVARHAADDMAAVLKGVREAYPDVPVKMSVKRGHPSAVLADASRQACLTVVGAHRHHGPLSLGVGPIIHGLLAHAESPVAIVPVA
jgi:nucleotide-binding universal stress UspA family protein